MPLNLRRSNSLINQPKKRKRGFRNFIIATAVGAAALTATKVVPKMVKGEKKQVKTEHVVRDLKIQGTKRVPKRVLLSTNGFHSASVVLRAYKTSLDKLNPTQHNLLQKATDFSVNFKGLHKPSLAEIFKRMEQTYTINPRISMDKNVRVFYLKMEEVVKKKGTFDANVAEFCLTLKPDEIKEYLNWSKTKGSHKILTQ